MSTENQYALRDAMWLDQQGGHYVRHVDHMTREGLHSKSDIAAELGWRDYQLAELARQVSALQTSQDNINNGLGIKGDGPYSQLVLEKFIALHAKCDALAAENSALKGGIGFFAYSTECGYEEFDTEQKAIDFATDEIDDFRGYACDGWSDEVGSVCWGVIMQRATEIDRRKRNDEDSCDSSIEEVCDYTLLPVIETPNTDAAIAEIKAQGVDELATNLWDRSNELVSDFAKKSIVIQTRVAAKLAEEFAANLRAGRKG